MDEPTRAEVTARIAPVLADQDGVITRVQVYAAGAKPHDLQRMIRRSELTLVHPRVYINHSGPLTWQQRAWAAVLYAAPAALAFESAIRAGEGPGRRARDDKVIHVAVDQERRLEAPDGVRIHRVRGFAERVQWSLGPPRIHYDDAILDLAAEAPTVLDAVGRLADACGSRRTTAQRLLDHAELRSWLPRRTLITSVLADVASGTNSALEHAYLDKVERPHGLPQGQRQASVVRGGGTAYQDVRYEEQDLVVELDSQLFHESVEARDTDLDRDLDAAVAGQTIRIGWGQVVQRPCRTAVKVGAVLNARGWSGAATPCPECLARAA